VGAGWVCLCHLATESSKLAGNGVDGMPGGLSVRMGTLSVEKQEKLEADAVKAEKKAEKKAEAEAAKKEVDCPLVLELAAC